MSSLSARLSLPSGIAVPQELEQAWCWMEEQGWSLENDNGYFLTPYAGKAQLGIVFSDQGSLEGWFEPNSYAAGRLAPLAEISGDGGMAALWLDDAGLVRIVALGAMGKHVLADSALDFLRLIAIGYLELQPFDLGIEPEDAESIDALAPFRAWVEATYDVTVPDQWPAPDQSDEFASWVDLQLSA